MRITRLGGYVSNADTTLRRADKIETLMEADAAIAVGLVVAPDSVSNTLGILCVPTWLSTVGGLWAAGIYEGQGGTGTAAATAGLGGRDAADGDLIFVTCYGPATAIHSGIGTAGGIAVVAATTTAGNLFGLANATTVINSPSMATFLTLEASTAGQNGPIKYWVRAC